MKNTLLAVFCFIASALAAQTQVIPSVSVKDLDGNTLDFKTVCDTNELTVISFWATWCTPCIKELEAINDHYADWRTKFKMKLVAVSIDDARNSKKVKPKVLGYGWEYQVLLDENSDVARAMNVNNPPVTFIVNKKGEILWSHQGYTPGAEEELEKKLEEFSAK